MLFGSVLLFASAVVAQTASLQSQIDVLSIDASIRKYATPGNWNQAMLNGVNSIMNMPMTQNPQVATSPWVVLHASVLTY